MQDLIQPQNGDLQIRENENGVYVAGVSEREVSSMDDCLNLLHIGDRNRCRLPVCLQGPDPCGLDAKKYVLQGNSVRPDSPRLVARPSRTV